MSDKFQNRYRIPSARLQNWDYGSNAAYFITICTQHRECWFGHIQNGNRILSEIGNLANRYWQDIPTHFPFVKLGEFIVMSNHIHGIIIIDHTIVETPDLGVSNVNNDTHETKTPGSGVSTTTSNGRTMNASEKWKPATVGVIVNQYKRIVTIHARKINTEFEWQSRFYDHIIRNDESFQRIANYIVNNPLKWNDDKFFDTNNAINN
jgi:putative transposase